MKKIELTQGKFAIVDEEDYDLLVSMGAWCVIAQRGYAGKRHDGKIIYMHRFLNNTPKGFLTDHVNGDKLDNRRKNLRTVNIAQNARNRHDSPAKSSGIRGVTWDKAANKWLAQITVNYINHNLGRYPSVEEASKAREDFINIRGLTDYNA